ncbi:amino acid permease [Alkaliphilus sp. MSJ-5]|uniref:Amino acid permease n=1 Tax=Alkaliphilus flagellatus TaxID=2841507 RepID=A0ABS6G541_9FIRM|nr:amino acid permease [Alkaliphilus flagellatus]MBU5677261.1 amino acid permease [Alkaliphilus flagellatus]
MSQQNLKKSITFSQAISIVVGVIIGSGIFLKTGTVFQNAGSPYLGVIAWFVGGIITLTSALTIAEISSAIPETGGIYTYLKVLYGDVWAFLLGWVQTIIAYPASAAALAIAFSTFATFFVPLTDIQQKLLAIFILMFVVIMNIIATKFGGMIQLISTIGKLIPLVVIIVFGLIKGTANDFSFIGTTTAPSLGFGAALLGTLWAYDGWAGVTTIAGELKNPSKELPKAIILGVSSVIGVYVIFNLALLKVLPMDEIIKSSKPASDAATILFGQGGATFVTIGILVSVFGALNGYILTGARVPLAMGEKGQLPFSNFLKQIHPKLNTPANSLITISFLAILYILSGSFNTLTDLTIFILWIFFVMTVCGIFILRRRKNIPNAGYKVPLFPIVPLIGILGGSYILYSTLISSPVNSLIGIGIALLGLPFYFYLKTKK